MTSGELAPPGFEYAPAPESREIVRHRAVLRPLRGRRVARRRGRTYTTLSPADETPLAEIGQAGEADVDAAVAAARGAFEGEWSALRPAERAKYLFRIARLLAERSREFAVLESLNGGKPIKESRDVDLPLAAAHFFYYAGWADKLEYAFPNRTPRPVGVAAQVIPWNFPLLMLAWKIAPALAAGNTVVLKPAETTPLTALLFCDVLRQAELPPGVVNIVTGDGRTGAALVKHPDVDKVAFTGSTDVGKAIQRELAGTGKGLTLELGGKAANIVFDDAPLDQAIEGIVNGIYFNQGHVCCAGSRLLVQESIQQPVIEKLKRRLATLRVGDPLDKNTDVGAINSAQQLQQDRGARGRGRGGGRRDLPAALPPARDGLLVRPDRVHERRAELPDRAGGDLRAGALRAHLPHARGGDREGQQHRVRPERRRVDGEGLAHPLDGRAPARGRRVGEHVQPLRPDVAVRRLQGVGLRPRGRPARAGAVPEVRRRRWSGADDPRAGAQDVQALRGRRVPALGVGAHVRGRGPQHRARLAQGPARRGPRRARRRRQVVRPDRLQPRPGALPRRRDDGGARGRARRAVLRAREEVERAVDRMVWYAGWTDKLPQVLGGANPVAGPYFNFTVPEPTGVVGIVAPAEPALAGLVSRLAPALAGGNARRGDRERGAPARRDRARRGARDLRRARRRREPADRASAPSSRRSWPRTSTSTRSTSTRPTPSSRRSPPTTSSASCARQADRQSLYEISSFLELKTVWHPMGQ